VAESVGTVVGLNKRKVSFVARDDSILSAVAFARQEIRPKKLKIGWFPLTNETIAKVRRELE
jgi:hypothetical protein